MYDIYTIHTVDTGKGGYRYKRVMANSRKRKKTTVKHENRRKFQNFISLTNSGQELKKTFRNN